MRTYRLTETYRQAFGKFLAHTNEKQVLLAALLGRIEKLRPKRMLDIGAGNGDLALPLARSVAQYVAIEPNAGYAAKLREQGLDVIEKPFPCAVPGVFDVAVLSHVLPWGRAEYTSFLEWAWSAVAEKGSLLVVTYDDEPRSEWNNFLSQCGLAFGRAYGGRMEGVESLLKRYGEVGRAVITTHVETDSAQDMIEALAFVYSDGLPEKLETFRRHEKVRTALRAQYQQNGIFRFPFDHLLLEVRRV